jgi:NTE family protein
MIEASQHASGMFIYLAFSGGGMRASALAYAVLEKLAAERIRLDGRDTTLLDEVDIINAVSGGSMTAAYYALHRERMFRDFESRFLARDLEDQLRSDILSLAAVPRLLSPHYGRIDMVQEFLDKNLYDGKTFADIPRRKPFVQIVASDMGLGSRFEFNQATFDLLCSDLDKFPVARAVAASSAVPMLFSPVTLWNYAERCTLEVPETPAWLDRGYALRQAQRMHELLSYRDSTRRPFIHLLDGGLSDNIGTRSLLENAILFGGMDNMMRIAGVGEVKKLAVIVVNAETESDRSVDRSAEVPSIAQVIRALADVPINRYSYETALVGRRAMEDWQQRRAAAGRPVEIYAVEVDLKDVKDETERQFLNAVPTSLQLPKDTVRRILRAGRRLLDESEDFQRLLKSLR